jgi:hypothetical protein
MVIIIPFFSFFKTTHSSLIRSKAKDTKKKLTSNNTVGLC